MQAYAQLKDTDVKYLNTVPSEWRLLRSSMLFKENKANNEQLATLEPMQFKFGEIVDKEIDVDEKIKQEIKRYIVVEPGDIIVNGLNLNYDFVTQRVAIVKKIGCITPAYICLRPRNIILPEFACYLLKGLDGQKVFNGWGTGIRLTLNFSEFKKYYLPVPEHQTQLRIVNYLDKETKRIDELILKQEELLELIEEKRRATITHAVTQGLDKGAELKETGIPWLSKVPKNWEITEAKRLFGQRKERATPGQVQLTASQKYGVITQREYMERENTRIVVVEKDHDILKQVEPGDFVISMRSFQGGLEYSRLKGSISSAYVMLYRLKDINDEYFKYLFKCDGYIQMLQSTSNLIRDGQALRYANFMQVPLPLPPKNEQSRIAEYLDDEKKSTDLLKQSTHTQIKLLKDRRNSLIFHVVTGRVKI